MAKSMDALMMDLGDDQARMACGWAAQIQHCSPLSKHLDFPGSHLAGFNEDYGILYRLAADAGAADAAGHKALTVDDLSPDQTRVYEAALEWFNKLDGRYFGSGSELSIGGYAGTGKSTVVSLLADAIGARNVAFVAYTGKASSVLNAKLKAAGVSPGFCGTLHSLMYIPEQDEETGRVTGWRLREYDEMERWKLIVLDEASMVDRSMWGDLTSYSIPVLAVGDHGQLPPIGRDAISPVDDPDLRLETVHRQAADNPIIQLATMIRRGERWADWTPPDDRVVFTRRHSLRQVLKDVFKEPSDMERNAVLCRYNKTRVALNRSIRNLAGLSGNLAEGDSVICLKNTAFDAVKVSNGMRGTLVVDPEPDGDHHLILQVLFPDDGHLLVARVSRWQFDQHYTFREFDDATKAGHDRVRHWGDIGMLFDFGGSMTVHKSQGSQFDLAGVVVESNRHSTKDEDQRWLYTAVTRAANRLVVAL